MSRHNYRPLPDQARGDRDSTMYDDLPDRSDSKDRYRRRSPSPRRQSPPHDLSRRPPYGPSGEISIKGAASQREWDLRRDRDNFREREDYRSQSPRRNNRDTYRDRDREDYRSPGYDDRSRSQSPARRRGRSPEYAGPPSREIILEGLPLDMTQDDVGHHPSHPISDQQNLISKELKQFHDVDGLEDIRVIRDRKTGGSRGFGFLRFSTISKSQAFLERNHPAIYLYGNPSADGDDKAAKVNIAFSRERDDREKAERAEGGWICATCSVLNYSYRSECFRCQTSKSVMAATQSLPSKATQFMNTGDSDASPDSLPSQFLLLRGLEPTVTEELLAKGVTKLYKSGRSATPPPAAQAKKGSAKVASTTSDSNLGAKDGSLMRVLLVRDRRSNESWRYGFAEFATVEDAQAALTKFNALEKFTISSKQVIISYIHAGVFVPVYNSTAATERFTFSPLGNSAIKLAYWDEEAYVTELSTVTEDKAAAAKASDEPKRAARKAATAAEREGLVRSSKVTEAKAKKRKADATSAGSNKKAVAPHLEFWRNRHAELHGVQTDNKESTGDTSDNKVSRTSKDNEQSAPPSHSFADLIKKCCYLCSRQFKTEAEVNKHERLSQLHRDNLFNTDLKTKALAKIAKAASTTAASAPDTPEYRDRARERRATFKAPKKGATDSKPTTAEPDVDEATPPQSSSKGAALLGKMGWAKGEGLGAQGTGMTAPIETNMYVQGVGLGAAGGKVGDAVVEADRNTGGGYKAFQERTREGAKERFERLG
ncbi:MAG: hypothetical protein M1812_007713 [Candelaria pacifica]|nr:MAG: hypothetical protein M1812_007713 [Candelaria pacifica]